MPGQYAVDPMKHTLSPIVTGATVIGIKFDGGVLLAADTLASYGSQARYKNCTRLRKVGEFSMLGASGEISDFQYLGKMLDDLDLEDWLEQDGCLLGPKEYASYIGRVMYNRRSKGNPLYNQFVVVGAKPGSPPLLAFVDHQGTFFEEDYIATGFGAFLGMPLLREAAKEKNGAPFTKDEAEALAKKCLQICFYRDCHAYNKIQIGICDGTSTSISEPITLDHFWEHKMWTEKRLEFSTTATADTW